LYDETVITWMTNKTIGLSSTQINTVSIVMDEI